MIELSLISLLVSLYKFCCTKISIGHFFYFKQLNKKIILKCQISKFKIIIQNFEKYAILFFNLSFTKIFQNGYTSKKFTQKY